MNLDKISLDNGVLDKKDASEPNKLDKMLWFFHNTQAAGSFDVIRKAFKELGFSEDDKDLANFENEMKEKISQTSSYPDKYGESMLDEESKDYVSRNLSEFIERVKSSRDEHPEKANANVLEKLGNSTNKISARELSALDAGSGKENGDFASTIYILTKINNEDGFFTKQSLIDTLVDKDQSPETMARVEKTVSNFIDKGYLKKNEDGNLFADFDLIG